MEAPGYGEEEEPLNTILGKVWVSHIWSTMTSDLARVNETSQFDYNINDSCHLQTVFTGLDHHQKDAVFATCGQQVDIWDEQRSSPIRSFTWGVDSFSAVRFNPVEVKHYALTTVTGLVLSQREECFALNNLSVFKLTSKWWLHNLQAVTLLIYLKWMVYFSTDRTSCKLCLRQKYSTVWHERICAT